jgi:hypothetical protein
MPNMSQMRVWRADFVVLAFFGADFGTAVTRTGGLLLRALVLGFALGATDPRFLGGALLPRLDLGAADFAGAFVVRFALAATEARFFAGGLVVRLAFALGAVDFRFFGGAFVVLF